MLHSNHCLRQGLMTTAATLVLAIAAPAIAQDGTRLYDLKPQPLAKALAEVARLSGRQVVVSSSTVRGKAAPALSGRYTADEAYAALLSGSGLKLTPVGSTLVVRPATEDTSAGEAQAGGAETLSELVVTGTRIRGAAPVGSSLISISRADIEASGYSTTQQLLQAIPQNYGGGPNEATAGMSVRNNAGANLSRGSAVNLRGLGASSTLVLINGERPALGGTSGAFADLSLIPSSAIDHVEVLADGASALYGSDAVAGVVNLKLRGRFEGAETGLRYGHADGVDERQFSQILGRRWSSGHAVIAYEYNGRGRLAAADRSYATSDLRAFGGVDYRANYASPGTIIAGGRNFAIPAGQNGVGLAVGQLRPDQINREDAWKDADLAPRQSRHAGFISLSQDLTSTLTLSGQALLAARDFDGRVTPNSPTAVTVPTTNPFYLDPIGTRQPVRVQYSFVDDLGPQVRRGKVRAFNLSGGLTKRLGPWSASLTAGAGRQRETSRSDNQLSTYRLGLAVADTNPATAYNLFGDAGSTNRATIDAVRGYSVTRGVHTVAFAAVKADGPLFDLPAGPVKLAIGAEYRRERFRQDLENNLRSALAQTQTAYPDARRITAAYGELLVPLAGGAISRPGLRSLTLSLAGRAEQYSDFGSTANPKLGLDWAPINGVKVKASYGESFRAPSFEDQLQGTDYIVYQPATLSDPAAPTRTSNVLALLGNTADLGPERAKTATVTVELAPIALPTLKVALSYFRIAYRDRISSINGDVFNSLINRSVYAGVIQASPDPAVVAAYYASPYFFNPSNIAAANIQYVVDARLKNIASVFENGLDLDASYGFDLAGGQALAALAGTYLLDLERAVTPGAPKASILGTVGNPVRWRVRGRFGWSRGGLDLASALNVVDGYRNQTLTPSARVKSWTTVDLSAAYRVPRRQGRLEGLRIALSATNLFDRDPPFIALRTPTSATGFDADNASPIGRLLALSVTKTW